MAALPQVLSEPLDVTARLAQLGLTPAELLEAVKGGYLGKSTCTENDPPSYPGSTFWAVTTRSLRELLLPRGWERSDEGNYSIVASPDGFTALVVATGDEWTGIPSRSPKTHSKGPATFAAVERNRYQLDLFDAPTPIRPTPQQGERKPLTWVLLILHSATRGICAELSLPLHVGEDGRIESWQERIILPTITDDGSEVARGGPEPAPRIDVEVVRKAG